MYHVFMLLIYIITLFAMIFMLSKYLKSRQLRKYLNRQNVVLNIRASRLVFLLKVLKALILKHTIVIVITTVIIFMIISASATLPYYVWTVIKSKNMKEKSVLIELKKPIDVNYFNYLVKVIRKEVMNISEYSNVKIYPIIRVLLGNPLFISDINKRVYVLVAIPQDLFNYIVKINKKAVSNIKYIIACNASYEGGSNRKSSEMFILCMKPTQLKKIKILDDISLIPIQGYIGVKPIFPPLNRVIITRTDIALKLVGKPDIINNILLRFNNGTCNDLKMTVLTIINKFFKESVRTAYVGCDGKLYVYGEVTIPTFKSLATAFIASMVSSLTILIAFSSSVQSMKEFFNKLIVVGMPSWSVNIAVLTYITAVMLIIGIPTLIIIYNFLGGLSTFNSFLTWGFSWITSAIYLTKVLKPRNLTQSDVYVPATKRYELHLDSNISLKEIEKVIKKSIITNEFFTLEEYESKYFNENEVVIHTRLLYNEAWGSGLDLNIILSRNSKEGTKIYITSYVWGIEEISETVMNTMLALALSRIVGSIRAWFL